VVRHIFQACPVWIYTQSNIIAVGFGFLGINGMKNLFDGTFCHKIGTGILLG
jgi:hypothetical protein